jgi:hypothetical protein
MRIQDTLRRLARSSSWVARAGRNGAVVSLLAATCLVAAAASAAGASVKAPPTSAPVRGSATCTAEEQAANQAALAAYLKRMPLDRKAYFRKHHDKAHRRAFVRRQRAKLSALQAAAACEIETPAPPPPPYQSGHYAGKTSQNEDFEFDVSADGADLLNLVTGQINESCQDFNIFGGNIHATGAVTTISGDGRFSINHDHSGTFSDGTPYQEHLTITGRLSGTTATGTLLETLTATIEGTAESCTSNPQTWSAARTG